MIMVLILLSYITISKLLKIQYCHVYSDTGIHDVRILE
nr:hypothetical protein TDPV-170 [Oriental turtle dovepox virus]